MAITSRSRNRKHDYLGETRHPVTGALITSNILTRDFEIIADRLSFPRIFNPCLHCKCLSKWSGTVYEGSSNYSVKGYADALVPRTFFTNKVLPFAHSLLLPTYDFQKDNKANLLVGLFEMDDTIKLFSSKFWRELSYGSVNWGLLPLYSDLVSLAITLDSIYSRRIQNELANKSIQNRVIYRKFTYSDNSPNGNKLSFEGSIRFSGILSFDTSSYSASSAALRILLDELGVHPDLSTLWDIIPLSFVVDYFLPVGDLIDKVHPRGWFNPSFRLTGSCTVKGTVSYNHPVSNQIKNLSGVNTAKCFDRRIFTNYAQKRVPSSEIEFTAPSVKQIVDTGYIGLSKRTRGAKKLMLDAFTAGAQYSGLTNRIQDKLESN